MHGIMRRSQIMSRRIVRHRPEGTVGIGNLLIGPVVAAVGITTVLLFGAAVALMLAWYADVRTPPPEVQVVLGAELAQ